MSIIHVVSVSGGKDSAATLLLAIERFGIDRVRIFLRAVRMTAISKEQQNG